MASEYTEARKKAFRHNRIDLKLSDDELAVVNEKAKNANLKVTTYIRKAAVEGEIKVYDMNDTVNLMRSFNAIGTNLNQIARVVNSTGAVFQKDIDGIKEQFEYFRDVMENYLNDLLPKEIL